MTNPVIVEADLKWILISVTCGYSNISNLPQVIYFRLYLMIGKFSRNVSLKLTNYAYNKNKL